MRRLTPLAAATLIVAIGALLYGWSVWGNGYLGFRGADETGDVAANEAGSSATDDAVVGVVTRDPDPVAPTELAEPDLDPEADLDSEAVRLDALASVQEPASAGFDTSPEAETDAPALVPETGPIGDAMSVAARQEIPPSEPIEPGKAVQAGDDPETVAADPLCPLPIAGVGPPGDPACEAAASVAPPNTNLATPAAAGKDTTMPESRQIAELDVPANQAAATPDTGASPAADLVTPATVSEDSAMSETGQIAELTAPAARAGATPDTSASPTADLATPSAVAEDAEMPVTGRIAERAAPANQAVAAPVTDIPPIAETEITVARLAPEAAAGLEAVTDPLPSEALPAPRMRDQTVGNPADMAAPTFDIVRVAPGGTAVIAGRAAPGAEVSVIDRDAVVGSAVADARGEWVVVPDRPLPAGPSEIGLVARSKAGVEAQSEQVVVLVVPDTPSAAVVADAPAERPVAVLMARAGNGETRFLQGGVPGGGIAAPEALRLESVSYDDAGDFDISGTAIPGNMIAAYLDNQPIGRAPVDTDGKWRLLPDKFIDPGLYTLRIDQVDKSGLVVSRLETPFSIADLTAAAVAEGLVIVQPGNSLWRIARRIYGKGVQHTVIFDANIDQIRDPNLIYPGQIFIVPGESADG